MEKLFKSQKGIVYFSVLLAILPILFTGAGIGLYNQFTAQDAITEATSQISNQEVSIYNSAVDSYLGDSKKGVDSRACIDAIISSNNVYAGDSGKFIALEINGTTIGVPGNINNTSVEVETCSSQMSSQKANINMEKRYDITATYNSNGLVEKVIIKEN